MKLYTIKQASSFTGNFISWATSRAGAQAAKRLGAEGVLTCLRAVIELYNDGIGISTSFDWSAIFGPIQAHLPCILGMRAVIDDPSFQPYIGALAPTIHEFDRINPLTGAPLDVTDGMRALIEAYENDVTTEDETSIERMTTREKIRRARLDMASYLIDTFSNDLAQAADQSGNPEIAALFRSKAIAQPERFIENSDIGDFQVSEIKEADRIVDAIWNSYGEERHEEVYWYVKNAVNGYYFGGYNYRDDIKKRLQYYKNMEEMGFHGQLETFMRENTPETERLLFPASLRILVAFFYKLLSRITQDKRYRY